jgi:hypothetical protein
MPVYKSISISTIVLALAMTACATRQPTAPAASTAPAVSTAPSTGQPAAGPVTGPMTGPELVWLEGIGALHKKMDDVVRDSPSALTSKSMRSLAGQLAGCTPALERLGPPTDRLRPVLDLARKGCAQYAKAGKCFDTAAGLGTVIQGSDDEKKQTASIDCGFAAPGDGSKFFAEAEVKGLEIKDEAR